MGIKNKGRVWEKAQEAREHRLINDPVRHASVREAFDDVVDDAGVQNVPHALGTLITCYYKRQTVYQRLET